VPEVPGTSAERDGPIPFRCRFESSPPFARDLQECRQPENWVALICAVVAPAAICGGGGVILSSRRFVPGRLFDRSRHFRSQNAARPGERFKRLPRRLVITFAGQGSAACVDSGLVRRTAASGRPIIQQLKGFPGASNGVGNPSPTKIETGRANCLLCMIISRGELKMAAKNMHGPLGNVRVGPLLQYHHANVGLCVSAAHSAEYMHQSGCQPPSDRPALPQHASAPENLQSRQNCRGRLRREDQRV
jgi:hypothetical protein